MKNNKKKNKEKLNMNFKMIKEEFLKNNTQEVIETFESSGNYTKTFTVLYDDGSTDSFAISFHGIASKNCIDTFMKRICEDPKIIASIFASEVWTSKMARKLKKKPSECVDRVDGIMIIYNTRDNVHNMQVYKPDKNRKLQLEISEDSFSGRFDNPFESFVPLTEIKMKKSINKFLEDILDSLFKSYKELNMVNPMLFFFANTKEQITLRRLNKEEWEDRSRLKQTLKSGFNDPKTLAIVLALPENDNSVNIIFATREIKELLCYKKNPFNQSFELESRKLYDEKSLDIFKNN